MGDPAVAFIGATVALREEGYHCAVEVAAGCGGQVGHRVNSGAVVFWMDQGFGILTH